MNISKNIVKIKSIFLYDLFKYEGFIVEERCNDIFG